MGERNARELVRWGRKQVNVREPLGALACIAGAHKGVNDGIALAQVAVVARARRSRVRISTVQVRDRKDCRRSLFRQSEIEELSGMARTSIVTNALQVCGNSTRGLVDRVE